MLMQFVLKPNCWPDQINVQEMRVVETWIPSDLANVVL